MVPPDVSANQLHPDPDRSAGSGAIRLGLVILASHWLVSNLLLIGRNSANHVADHFNM